MRTAQACPSERHIVISCGKQRARENEEHSQSAHADVPFCVARTGAWAHVLCARSALFELGDGPLTRSIRARRSPRSRPRQRATRHADGAWCGAGAGASMRPRTRGAPHAGQPRVTLHRHGGRIGSCHAGDDHRVCVCNAQLTAPLKFVGRTSRLHAYSGWAARCGEYR